MANEKRHGAWQPRSEKVMATKVRRLAPSRPPTLAGGVMCTAGQANPAQLRLAPPSLRGGGYLSEFRMLKPLPRETMDFYQRELGSISITLRVIAWLAAAAIVGFGFMLALRAGDVVWLLGAVGTAAVLSIALHLAAEGMFAMHSNLHHQVNDSNPPS